MQKKLEKVMRIRQYFDQLRQYGEEDRRLEDETIELRAKIVARRTR